jgi:outer membrane protein assembly factor BamD (BamD/ComL family)
MASTRSKSAHASKLREGGVAMNMKKIGLCSLFLLGALLLSSEARQPKKLPAKRVALERDQLLFLEGAKALSKGRYDEARVLLNTMRWTYSDSPLIEETKLLIFYSYARQGGAKYEESAHDYSKRFIG